MSSRDSSFNEDEFEKVVVLYRLKIKRLLFQISNPDLESLADSVKREESPDLVDEKETTAR